MCVQVEAKGLNFAGPLNDDAIGTLIDNFFANVGGSLFSGGDEDCLFLDLYVPGAAIDSPSTTSLPVVVWFYGGAYCELDGFTDGRNRAEMMYSVWCQRSLCGSIAIVSV